MLDVKGGLRSRAESKIRPVPSFASLCGLAIALVTFWPAEIHAYIDPGTGSLAVQTFVAFLLGLSIALHRFRSGIASFFGRWTRRRTPREKSDSESQ